MSRTWSQAGSVLRAAGAALLLIAATSAARAASPPAAPVPEVGAPVLPTVWNGDLRDLPQVGPLADGRKPFIADEELTPNEIEAMKHTFHGVKLGGPSTSESAPAPAPIANFAGLDLQNFGAGWPPDTNGDVGPNHYIQVVNTSVGIFDKATGARLVGVSFDTFFQASPDSACRTLNFGDPVALYDPMADRWLVTDFAFANPNPGFPPYYQCIAVSQSGDPVSGGWYFYQLRADTGPLVGYLNDYPKLGVWPDGYYMTDNMFGPGGTFAVRLWALDRSSMLSGGPLNEVHFDICQNGACGSFLPGNVRGTAPPGGTPEFFATAGAPDHIDLYRFHVDWTTPANSTLTGPIAVPVAQFSGVGQVPAMGGSQLDSLSFRLMMQLQYRNFGDHEALFVTHSIDVDGRAAARWYEIRDPAGTPTLFQEGDQSLPDGRHRWMGSIAADQDGNLALGYSVSSSSMFPAIRYAGRRVGEVLGQLPQTETELVAGGGAQTNTSRWCDYSAMSVDPTDDCTFWYTTEYYVTSGANWQTRIGSFKFPSCGQSLGTLDGQVVDSVTSGPIPNAPVTVDGTESLSTVADGAGNYSLDVLPGTYTLTAGPVPPGYPASNSVPNVAVTAGNTTTTDIPLDPVPFLDAGTVSLDDSGSGGNGNGFAEPGESGIHLTVELENIGAATSHSVSTVLSTATGGVTITQPDSGYPDIPGGSSAANSTDYVFSLDSAFPCGDAIAFHLAVTSDEGSFSGDVSVPTGILEPRVTVLADDFESGANGWTTGGSPNTWALTTESSNSPTHSWTDSPGANYLNNTNSWLISPVFDLGGRANVRLSASYTWDLESGYDYVYVQYSTNGGTSWVSTPLASFNGSQSAWTPVDTDAPALDGITSARVRFRLQSDGGVVADGIHVDDFSLTYQPVVCQYPAIFRDGFETGDASQWSSTAP
jgi:Carboxypeptidase regulatory-like domain